MVTLDDWVACAMRKRKYVAVAYKAVQKIVSDCPLVEDTILKLTNPRAFRYDVAAQAKDRLEKLGRHPFSHRRSLIVSCLL